jgi:transcriptional regulator with XRE-family HTH domain
MANRRLSPRAVSRTSGRAESTINQLLSGRIAPKVEVIQDIAPALEMSVADLLVIAGVPVEWEANRPGVLAATLESSHARDRRWS